MHPLVLHPRTIAKIIRNLKACCPNQNFTNVNSGWLVGVLTHKQRRILATLDISAGAITKEELERYFRNSRELAYQTRNNIKIRVKNAMKLVIWPRLHSAKPKPKVPTNANTVNP
jgi:hypothetical protein